MECTRVSNKPNECELSGCLLKLLQTRHCFIHYVIVQRNSRYSSPVQRHIGIKNGTSHCFGASIVTDCTQADSSRLPTQTAALLLHISLHLQSDSMTKERIKKNTV